jgi:PAS domain S-box-containing protein
MFLLCVVATAWFGGAGPGFLAALLATLALPQLIPMNYPLIADFFDLPRFLTFGMTGLAVGWGATRRKRAEEALRASELEVRKARDELEMKVAERTAALRSVEERHALATAASEEGFWDWIVAADDFYASPRLLEIYGFPPGTVFAGRNDFLARFPIHPEDRLKWREAVAEHFAGKTVRFDKELRILRGGETRWLHLIGLATRNDAGEVVRWTGATKDVTARKFADEALRVSEERYARAMEGSDAGLWQWNPVTDVAFASPRAHQLFGIPDGVEIHSREDLKAYAGFHPEDRERVEEAMRACLARRSEDFEAEYRVIHPTGETRWVRSRGKVFPDAEGRPALISGSVTDIDARKRVEDALRLSEERYALAMHAAEDSHWDWIVGTDQYYLSPRTVQLFGLPEGTTFASREDYLAKTPLVREDLEAWLRAARELFAGTGSRLSMELRANVRGEMRWIQHVGVCVRDASGKPVRWSGTGRDVTERRRTEEALRISEERYARAMEGSDAGHWDWNLATDEMFVSASAREMLCLPAGALPATRTEIMALVPEHPDDREAMTDLVKAGVASGHHERDYRVITASGEARWLRSRAKVFKDEKGAPARMTGSLTDITERRKAEEELRRLERQLRNAQRLEAVGTLASGVAHDFNNILGAILGYGEMALRDAPKGSRLRRDIESVMVAGERGRALVERILAFSRSGMAERVAVHVEDIAREALDQLAAKLPAGVRIQTRLRAGRAAVMGDPTQVHQVLMNLATNAIQAMPSRGTLQVSLDAVRLDEPRLATTGLVAAGEWLVLKVVDSGTGMPPEVLERIFDPFFTTKDVGVGTGLGLSLVHGIVTELGGAIDVASTPGAGSAFTVYLPCAGDAPEEQDAEEKAMPRGSRQRVLVVDDEEPLVMLATQTLEYLGYEPVGFTSSAAALEAFRADPDRFDAVITDERMPGMSGTRLIREVRGIRRAIPILLASGYVGAGMADHAHNAGADEVLKKPLLARELATSLARVFQPH